MFQVLNQPKISEADFLKLVLETEISQDTSMWSIKL